MGWVGVGVQGVKREGRGGLRGRACGPSTAPGWPGRLPSLPSHTHKTRKRKRTLDTVCWNLRSATSRSSVRKTALAPYAQYSSERESMTTRSGAAPLCFVSRRRERVCVCGCVCGGECDWRPVRAFSRGVGCTSARAGAAASAEASATFPTIIHSPSLPLTLHELVRRVVVARVDERREPVERRLELLHLAEDADLQLGDGDVVLALVVAAAVW